MYNKPISIFLIVVAIYASFCTYGDNIIPKAVDYRGPVRISKPWMMDSVDVNNKAFEIKSLLSTPGNIRVMPITEMEMDEGIILGGDDMQLHYLSFPINNTHFANVNVKVAGNDNYKIYLDGKESNGKLKLKPGTREITLQLLTLPGKQDTVSVSISSPKADFISLDYNNGRMITLDDILFTEKYDNVSVSPSGKYAIVTYSKTSSDKKIDITRKLISLPEGKILSELTTNYSWVPGKDLMWKLNKETDSSRSIIFVDPITFEETAFAVNVPEGRLMITPDLRHIVFLSMISGPKEDKDVYRVLNPEDRQPGWRDRTVLNIYDVETGVIQPMAFGNRDIIYSDISSDGKKLLFTARHNRFEKRPTTLYSLFEYNFDTNKVDTIVLDDGFITSAKYSPDGMKVIISGTPEALDGIGLNLPEGRIPNNTEGELFIMDLATKEINPITKYFDPSVQSTVWNHGNGNIYFTAEDKNKVSLFSYNPSKDKITNLNVPEEIVENFSISSNGKMGVFSGESASNPFNLYAIELKNESKPSYRRIDSTEDDVLSNIILGDVIDWNFVNSVGDTINGSVYLPPNFDPNKKYPLIVNYYGGCSPTSRNFASRYPKHLYAANGYVVYVVNPSGATGFGQEFASRHVNTAGEGVARDIIEGTEKLVAEIPYIDKDKIGCIGASYGGFMTQYLQTVTDLFAAAVSHAGISDHTSYWGNGYWGYSYSEISMADKYPWSDPDLYVKQSPLYNADKIHTPILFVHGDEDTNVPPAESIQLFTALNLLGKDTALVEVKGQNHHILDFNKRQKWQDTILAWFAKYLQDDPGWWEELYPTSSLQ